MRRIRGGALRGLQGLRGVQGVRQGLRGVRGVRVARAGGVRAILQIVWDSFVFLEKGISILFSISSALRRVY